MAKYNILNINKMTSGDKRGLLDMTIALDYKVLQKLLLLDKISLSSIEDDVIEVEDEAIATETGDYEYARTEFISDFKPENTKNPLAKEENLQQLILDETQVQIDASSMSACQHHPSTCEYYKDGDAGLSAQDEHYAIQLTPEWWLSSKIDLSTLHEFNSRISKLHVVFEFEKDDIRNQTVMHIENSTSQQLFPLNDILDLCVKSQFKKTKNNGNIPGNLIFSGKDEKLNRNIDIYLEFESYPIELCQCNNGAFVLTQPTTMQPYMLKSNIQDVIANSQSHQFQLKQEPIRTIMYNEADRYNSDSSSYEEALKPNAYQYETQDGAIQIFNPQTKITGINYSYVVNIDQMENQNRIYDNPTIYSNGDIHGSMMLTKSMFNSLYSIQMPDRNTMERCRTYCGIQNSQNKILLKYYDNVFYQFNRNATGANIDTPAFQYNHEGTITKPLYPYQKVEYFEPNKMASHIKHKSNLFSVKIFNSGLDDYSIYESHSIDKNIAEQIKRDIFNGIKALAESIAPANTQLFKAYYMTK